MGIVEVDLMRDQMNSQLLIDEQEPDEEEKYITDPPWFFLRTFRETVSIPGGGSENTVMFGPKEQMNQSLLKRRKGQYLNDTQIAYISSHWEIIKKWKAPEEKVSAVSIYTEKDHSVNEQIRFLKTILCLGFEVEKEAESAARSYLLPPWQPKSIPMIKKYIESKLRESYSTREIRNYVKCQMKYSYKKGNSRPPSYAEKRS